MRFHRNHSGLLIPDREFVPPGVCEMLMATQYVGFGGSSKREYQTLASAALDANVYGGWQTYAMRQKIAAAALLLNGTSQLRITFNADTDTGTPHTFAIDQCYINHAAAAGNAWDFIGAPTQVTFSGGSAGFNLSANGSIVSDDITFTIDNTKALIVAFDWVDTGNQGCRGKATLTNWSVYYKAGVNEANVTAPAGYTTGASNVAAISLIEAR